MIELAGCVIIKDKSILLIHRKKTDWYELPGGKVENGETPEQTAKRELKEELGCEVDTKKLLGQKEFEENGFTMKYHWFLSEVKEKNSISICEPEKFSHYRYIPIKELEDFVLSPNMQNLLKEIQGKNINV